VEEHLLHAFLKIDTLSFEAPPELPFCSTGMVGETKITVPLPPELQAKEKERLAKQLQKLQEKRENLEKRLANPSFIERAPEHLVQEVRDQLSQAISEASQISKSL